ncbi:hypothetical protein ACFL0D_01550 [Thermoproteota archaeon]
MKTSEQIYWVKAALGPITGVLCYYVQSIFQLQGQIALMLGATLYIAYSEALAMVFKTDRNRTIRIALGAFLFLWMLSWTLFNTMGRFGWV